MITVKQLRELLARYPDDASVNAYEGEDTGLAIREGGVPWAQGKFAWIRARETHEVDQQPGDVELLEAAGIPEFPNQED